MVRSRSCMLLLLLEIVYLLTITLGDANETNQTKNGSHSSELTNTTKNGSVFIVAQNRMKFNHYLKKFIQNHDVDAQCDENQCRKECFSEHPGRGAFSNCINLRKPSRYRTYKSACQCIYVGLINRSVKSWKEKTELQKYKTLFPESADADDPYSCNTDVCDANCREYFPHRDELEVFGACYTYGCSCTCNEGRNSREFLRYVYGEKEFHVGVHQ